MLKFTLKKYKKVSTNSPDVWSGKHFFPQVNHWILNSVIKKALKHVFVWNLLFLFLSQQCLFAAGMSGTRTSAVPKAFQIPAQLGAVKINSLGARSKLPLIVHIEDAHESLDAQKKIQSLLEYLNEQYGVHTYFLEGASGMLNPKRLDFFENKKFLAEYNQERKS